MFSCCSGEWILDIGVMIFISHLYCIVVHLVCICQFLVTDKKTSNGIVECRANSLQMTVCFLLFVVLHCSKNWMQILFQARGLSLSQEW